MYETLPGRAEGPIISQSTLHPVSQNGSVEFSLQLQSQKYTGKETVSCFLPVSNYCSRFRYGNDLPIDMVIGVSHRRCS